MRIAMRACGVQVLIDTFGLNIVLRIDADMSPELPFPRQNAMRIRQLPPHAEFKRNMVPIGENAAEPRARCKEDAAVFDLFGDLGAGGQRYVAKTCHDGEEIPYWGSARITAVVN
ncbi:hypothetical protein BD293_4454 [Roseinatronobacter monicus]|uniref:Uncharacterized protein n=1 Tax=Roseinatronobacter monicus TaxID=393481 RepID=A0A543K3X2_9RHOB|nr:hypothetical protein BD293_4454 [Roseinatronobacter monicus]